MKYSKPANLNCRIEQDVLDYIRLQAKRRGVSQSDFVSSVLKTERPLYEDFQSCLKVLYWLQEQGFLALRDTPVIVRYVEQCLKRYSALPITSANPIDIPKY